LKNVLSIALGVVTSLAGFIEVGSLSTSAQAGALFGYRLAWAVVLATLTACFLVEMSGRMAAVAHHPLAGAIRERFGIDYHAVPLVVEGVLDVLVLSAEMGGVCVALRLLTGLGLAWWIAPVALLVWLLLWRGSFSFLENGISLLGLVSLGFVVAVVQLKPGVAAVSRGLLPTLPGQDLVDYAFLAVSILGATVSPYLLNFYGSGAVEEKWDEKSVPMNRVVAWLGMSFGGLISLCVLIVAGTVLHPLHIRVDAFEQAAPMMTPVLGRAGLFLFAAALAVGCLGAALELALNLAYAVSQGLGWRWSKDQKPADDARFSLVYTGAVVVAALPLALGADPLRLTLLTMALTVLVTPLVVFPLLVIMNDPHYVGSHRNGWLANVLVALVVVVGVLLGIAAIPLELLRG
jgi:Mn2+/Fe2+ NRAMP family transporter